MAKYGFPFKGYNAVLDRWLVPPDFLTKDSHDLVLDPLSGSFKRREGSAIVGDVVTGTAAQDGILEDKWSANSTQMFAIRSPSMVENSDADDYPVQCVYYGNEANKQGQLYVRSSDTTLDDTGVGTGDRNYSFGREFSTTHYRQDASGTGAASWNLHWIPMWYDSGNGGMTRGVTALNRRFFMPGTRRGIDVSDDICFPNFDGTPNRWNKRLNETSTSGSEKNQLYPIGHIPGMGLPTIANGTESSTVGPWQKNNIFFYSVAFVDENDAVSMPLLPRDINDDLSSGFGRVTLAPTLDYLEYITWSNIPIGPPGTKARLLLRTDTTGDKDNAALTVPSISDLRVTAIIENNTQRTYKDYNGIDGSLIADPVRVRFDHQWMPPSRYMWASDHHIISGYYKPHPGAIVIAPWTANTTGDMGEAVTSNQLYSNSVIFIARIYNDNLEIAISTGNDIGGGSPNREQISLTSSTPDLQIVIDKVNANYTRNSGARGWVAQGVPGTDLSAAAANLLPTFFTVDTAATWTDADPVVITGSAGDFSDVAVGMQVSDEDNGELDGLYVASVNSDGSVVTLNAQGGGNTGSGTSRLGFAFDFGDDFYASNQVAAGGAWVDKWGWMRCYGQSYPGIFYWDNDYVNNFSESPRAMIFSGGEPGHAVNAVNNFYVGNRRGGLEEWGRLMGGAPVEVGSLVYYTNAVAKFRNIRGGKTGRDEDFRLESHDEEGSCISPYSIAYGNGWAVALEKDGLIVRGAGVNERVNISADVVTIDPEGNYRGAWAYEMEKCASSAASDADDYGFRVAVMGQQIHVTYRTAGGARERMIYDFTPSVSASGLRQVLRPDGTPYGWSPPMRQRVVDMIQMTRPDNNGNNSRPRRFGTLDDNNGASGDGRIDELDTGNDDNGQAITSHPYFSTDFAGSLDLKSAQWAKILYRKSSSGLKLRLSRDKNRSTIDEVDLASSGADPFKKKFLNLPQVMRTPREAIEFSMEDDGTGAPYEIWGIEAEVEVLDSAGV